MKNFFTAILLLLCIAAFAQQKEIPLLKYEELQQKILDEKAAFVVVNFWSTTCAPCLRELPDFMQVNEKYNGNPDFKMLLVSLDRSKDLERVRKFIRDKNLTAEVVILDDNKRMNTWIPKFDENWGGEIPVTVFYRNGSKVHFQNGEMHLNELEDAVANHFKL